jgi:acyl-coenzyme A thioesterase PaaI-like protein
MPRDVRELQDDPVAYAAELRRRWGGLLSYRYIGRNWSSMDLGPTDNTVTLRRDMRGPTGAILLAVLGIAAPEGGGLSDLEAIPNPVIHSCQVLHPGRDVRRIAVVSEVLKQGRQMGYSRSRIVDADEPGRVLAVTQGQGVSLGTPPAGLAKMPAEPIIVVDSPALPPLWGVFGATRRADGRWTLPELSSELASPDAALHLGPQFILLETAALHAASEAAGADDVRAISSHLMFLARGKVGPFRADAEMYAGSDGTTAVGIVLHDEGDGDRAVTAASYQFRAGG